MKKEYLLRVIKGPGNYYKPGLRLYTKILLYRLIAFVCILLGRFKEGYPWADTIIRDKYQWNAGITVATWDWDCSIELVTWEELSLGAGFKVYHYSNGC